MVWNDRQSIITNLKCFSIYWFSTCRKTVYSNSVPQSDPSKLIISPCPVPDGSPPWAIKSDKRDKQVSLPVILSYSFLECLKIALKSVVNNKIRNYSYSLFLHDYLFFKNRFVQENAIFHHRYSMLSPYHRMDVQKLCTRQLSYL